MMRYHNYSTMMYIITIVVTAVVITGIQAVDDTTTIQPPSYTAYDDATWAVLSSKLSIPHRQEEYNIFMDGCRASAGHEAYRLCDNDEEYRLRMNLHQPRSVCINSIYFYFFYVSGWGDDIL